MHLYIFTYVVFQVDSGASIYLSSYRTATWEFECDDRLPNYCIVCKRIIFLYNYYKIDILFHKFISKYKNLAYDILIIHNIRYKIKFEKYLRYNSYDPKI
jgi:hypothetical protein